MNTTISKMHSNNPEAKSVSISMISLLEIELSDLPKQNLQSFCRKIYPVELTHTGIYHYLYRNIIAYFQIQMGKANTYENVVSEINRVSMSISTRFASKLGNVLNRNDVKIKIIESVNSKGQIVTVNRNNKMNYTTLLDNLGLKPDKKDYGSNKNSEQALGKGFDSTFKKQNLPAESIAQKIFKQKNLIQNLQLRINFEKQLRQFGELNRKKCLICDNSIYIGNVGEIKRTFFQCEDCKQIFHRKCMPRNHNCAFCQIKNIDPLQKPIHQIFVGLLKKGTKRHELQFQLKREWKIGNNKNLPALNPCLELRCLRLKEHNDPVANFINLFPDACTVMFNNRLIKQFQPLHKQSSLKYRRDQTLKLPINSLLTGTNRIVITERILKKQSKADERIDIENHLIVIYSVQSVNIPKQANKLEQLLTKSGFSNNNSDKFLQDISSKTTSFSCSQNLLKQSMFLVELDQMQDQQDQIRSDSIKVPLVCSLTLQKMKYPGRSIFCKHFACFDVYNFILLNAQAKIPKWQCPICKASAYRFEIDCIMMSIVKEIGKLMLKNSKFKQSDQPLEIEFDSCLRIKFIGEDGKCMVGKLQNTTKSQQYETMNTNQISSVLVPGWIKNIYDLPIQDKSKRRNMQFELQQTPQKEKRLQLQEGQIVPEQQIIDISTAKQLNQLNLEEEEEEVLPKESVQDRMKLRDFTISIERLAQPFQVNNDYLQSEKAAECIVILNEPPAEQLLNNKLSQPDQQDLELQKALAEYEKNRKQKLMKSQRSNQEPPTDRAQEPQKQLQNQQVDILRTEHINLPMEEQIQRKQEQGTSQKGSINNIILPSQYKNTVEQAIKSLQKLNPDMGSESTPFESDGTKKVGKRGRKKKIVGQDYGFPGTVTVTIGGRQKLKRAAKEKNTKLSFMVPQDADIIQLSD